MGSMAPQYRLSNRQRKELLVRGQQLTILLPASADTSDETPAREWAARLLSDDVAPLVHSAEWGEAIVTPSTAQAGLGAVLGQIVPEEDAAQHWHSVVIVCRVVLRPRDCRGVLERPQWPDSVVFGDRRYPKIKEPEFEQDDHDHTA